jgi:hypothetical protein
MKEKMKFMASPEIASPTARNDLQKSHCEERSDEAISNDFWHSLRMSANQLHQAPSAFQTL